ncbi:MAG: hypothetical protein ACOCVY_00055 [Patescibacteria group bacterium]
MSLYRKIFKKTIPLSWHNKYLWFFGLFAAFLGGVGKYDISINKLSGGLQEGTYFGFARFLNSEALEGLTLSNFIQAFQKDPVSVVIIIILFAVLAALFLFVLWLSIVSQIGLVNNSAEAFQSNKKYSSLGIKDGVQAGVKNFWPVLGWNLIIKTIVYLSFALMSLPVVYFFADDYSLSAGISYLILFILFIPVSLILSLLLKYSICYIVLQSKSFTDAIKDSWKLFLNNWLISLEMGFILFAIQFLLTIALVLAGLAIGIPFLFLAILFGSLATPFFWMVISVYILSAIALTIFAGSIFTVFQISSWTALFLEITKKKGVLSKLSRLFPGLAK